MPNVTIEFEVDDNTEEGFSRIQNELRDAGVLADQIDERRISGARTVANERIASSERAAREEARIERESIADRQRNARQRIVGNRSITAEERRQRLILVDNIARIDRRIVDSNLQANLERLRDTRRTIGAIARLERDLEIQREEGLQALVAISATASQAFGRVASSLERFVGLTIRSSASMETFAASMRAATGSATAAEQSLRSLLRLTVELVGIDTESLFQYAARLQAAGLSNQQAESIISGVTRRVAEQGKTSEVTVRVLEQFTQAINSNIISMQDFRPIMREMPTLFRDFSRALGVSITNLDQLRQVANRFGGATNTIITALESISRTARGADLRTINAQLDILQDQFRLLAANLGRSLTPAIISALRVLNSLVQGLNQLPAPLQAAITAMVVGTTAVSRFAASMSGLITVIASLALIRGTENLTRALLRMNGQLTITESITQAVRRHLSQFAGVISRIGSRVGIIGAIVTAITALVTAVSRLNEISSRTREELDGVVDVLSVAGQTSSDTARIFDFTTRTLITLQGEQAQQLNRLADRLGRYQRDLAALRNVVPRTAAEQRQLADAIAFVTENVTALTRALAGFRIGAQQAADDTNLEEEFVNIDFAVRRTQRQLRDAESIFDARVFSAQLEQLIGNRANIQRAIADTITNARERAVALAEIEGGLAEDLVSLQETTQRRINAIIERATEQRRRLLRGGIRPQDIVDPQLPTVFQNIVDRISTRLNTLVDQQERVRRAMQQVTAEARGFNSSFGPTGRIVFELGTAFSGLRSALVLIGRQVTTTANEFRALQRSTQDGFEVFAQLGSQSRGVVLGLESIRSGLQQTGVATARLALQQQQTVIATDATRNSYEQLISNATDSVIELATVSGASFREIAEGFLRQSLRIVAQNFIQTQLLLASNRRLINSYNELAAARATAFGVSTGANRSVFDTAISSAVGVLGATGIVPQPVINLFNQLALPNGAIRDIGDILDALRQEGRN